jgi:hypothetical protein
VDFGLDHMERELAGEEHEWVKLGLVVAAKQFWEGQPLHYVALMECADLERRHCLKVRCEDGMPAELLRRARVLSGALVALTGNGTVKRLLTTSGYGFECVDDRCSPDELDIPGQWLGADPENVRI